MMVILVLMLVVVMVVIIPNRPVLIHDIRPDVQSRRVQSILGVFGMPVQAELFVTGEGSA